MSVNQALIEKVQVNQRLITDLLEEQSLVMVDYHRFKNLYEQRKDVLSEAQLFDAKCSLETYRTEINRIADRVLELQCEITTIIRGEV